MYISKSSGQPETKTDKAGTHYETAACEPEPSLPFPACDIVLIPGFLPIFLHSCKINPGVAWGRGYTTPTPNF